MQKEDKHFNRKEIRDLLIKHEGMVLTPYSDSLGHLTVGVGRALNLNPLTEEEAIYLLNNDIEKVIKQLDEHWIAWRSLPYRAQLVCVDMTFQLGIHGFLGFKRTRLLMEKGEFTKASEECLDSKWALQTPRRAEYNSRQLYLCQTSARTSKIAPKD